VGSSFKDRAVRRGLNVLVIFVAAFVGSPATAAVDGDDSKECWAKVDTYRGLATARWTADDPAGALAVWLELLPQALRCRDANAEQIAAIQVGFENVFVQVADGVELTELRGADVHRWYEDFRGRHPAAAAELVDAYHRFSAKIPAPAFEPPRPVQSENPKPSPSPGAPAAEGPIPDLPPDFATSSKRHGRALTISGASVLALGLGAVTAGFVSVARTVTAQRELNELCAVTCGDADTSAKLVARGQLHEVLAPALLASGAVATVTGAVLLGLGLRKQRTSLVAPVVGPRFAGASWVLRF